MGKIIEADRFRAIAEGNGPAAAAAAAIAVFRGSVYVGTGCDGLAGPGEPPWIMRRSAKAADWETVHEPPLIDASPRSYAPDLQAMSVDGVDRSAFSPLDRGKVPGDAGYRCMCVFQANSDPEPALYVGTMSRSGGTLLRSLDGRRFEAVGTAGFGDPRVYSVAALTGFGGRLFAAPAGMVTDEYLDPNLPPEAKLYVSDDPAEGVWQEACEPGFGDAANAAIVSLCVANGRLYAGTLNPERGYQLWETTAEGDPPFAWTQVIADGASAFNQNLTVSAMAEFGGALYVGSGITGYGYDRINDIGPASAELIRVHSDGSWDLIAGRMRFSRSGLKVPLSLLGPGLGDFYNSAIWALAEHEGVLYLGTHQWEALRALELDADEIVGGYQLWASEDGENWQVVIDDGGGNPAEFGVAALASTPLGLLVGTQSASGLLQIVGEGKQRELAVKPGFEVLLGK